MSLIHRRTLTCRAISIAYSVVFCVFDSKHNLSASLDMICVISSSTSGVNNGRHFQTVSVGCSASDDTKMTLSSVGGAEAAVGPPTPSLASPPSAFAPSPPKSALSNNGFWTLRHQRAGSQPGK